MRTTCSSPPLVAGRLGLAQARLCRTWRYRVTALVIGRSSRATVSDLGGTSLEDRATMAEALE